MKNKQSNGDFTKKLVKKEANSVLQRSGTLEALIFRFQQNALKLDFFLTILVKQFFLPSNDKRIIKNVKTILMSCQYVNSVNIYGS